MGRLTQGLVSYVAACLLLAVSFTATAQTQSAPYVEQDCAAIMESYAADPKSVAPEAVDNCRNVVNIAPAAGSPLVADASAVDPCADGADSVQCWGPWAAPLAPAAGGAGLPAAALGPTEYPMAMSGPGGAMGMAHFEHTLSGPYPRYGFE